MSKPHTPSPSNQPADPRAAQRAGDADAVGELRAINARFIHNFVTNDVASHDALLHPEFCAIQSDGSVLSRAAYLRQWAAGFDPDVIPSWETRGEVIGVHGPIALVRATNVFTVVRDGIPMERATMYTDTYVRSGRRWLCLQAQTTVVHPDHVASPSSRVSVYLRGVLQGRPIEP